VLTIKERDKKDKDAKEKKKKAKKDSAAAAAAAPTDTPKKTKKDKTLKDAHKDKDAADADADAEAPDLPPLKPGWLAIFDAASNKHYYHNAALAETTWDRNVAAAMPLSSSSSSTATAAASAPTLPPLPKDNADDDALSESGGGGGGDTESLASSAVLSASGVVASEAPAATAAALLSASAGSSSTVRKLAGGLDAVVGSLDSSAGVDAGPDGIERAYTVDRAKVPKVTRPALPEGQRETALPLSIADEINSFQLENYARKFFDHHKKGVFRRQIPIKRMLRWDSDAIPNAMIKTSKTAVAKEAVAQFKNIQRYMGDAAPSSTSKVQRSQMWYALQVIEKAVAMPELRDEIYVQLCKQTNDNPNPQSLAKGWELFVMCAYSFPPTKDFEDWLRQYIEANQKQQQGATPLFASYTLRLLNRTVRLFATVRSRVPSEKELQVQREAPFNPSPFGASLAECMELQAKRDADAKLPLLLTMLADAVLANNGKTTEGIFRVPADPSNALKLRVALEAGSYEIVSKDVHAIGSVLKLWLRELAEPLIPDALYDDCIKQAAEQPDKCVKLVQKRLQPLERACLLYLCEFLRTMAANSGKTKKTDANLAMVFAPNVLRCPSMNPQVIFENTKHEVSFLLTLIRQFTASE
jgi:hypothetical protein